MRRLTMASLVLSLVSAVACGEGRGSGVETVEPTRSVSARQRPLPAWRAPEPEVVEPRAETLLSPDQGQSKAARKVVSLLASLRDSVVETKYQARTTIRKKDGYYAWDCSGMAAWILRRTAPRARRALNSSRPVARDFYKMIDRAPTKRARRGWQQLGHVSEARPGDVFSWLRSPASKSKVTGHVGFFVDTPRALADYPNIYIARIVDATSLPHGDDTRARDGEGGFGFGTMLFTTDGDGETIGYGWHGERSLEWGFMPARVIYGRVTK